MRRGALALAGTVVAIMAAFWGPLFEGNLHEVIPGEIYRSGQPDPDELRAWIDELGLRSILSLRGEDLDAGWYQAQRAITREYGVAFDAMRISATHMPSRDRLIELTERIDALPRPLLLHCRGGVERSGLAAVVALLLEGVKPEQARRQFALRFGYHGWVSNSELPALVDDYADWLRAGALSHDAARFRRWTRRDYIAGVYGADLELLALPRRARVGEPVDLSIRATNRSSRPWQVRRDPMRGVHLLVRMQVPDARAVGYPALRTAPDDRVVPPGGSVELQAQLGPFRVAGLHRLKIDLANGDLKAFGRMGSDAMIAWIDVQPAGKWQPVLSEGQPALSEGQPVLFEGRPVAYEGQPFAFERVLAGSDYD